MTQRVLAGITVSLDGYYTGPNDRLGSGLGDGGERLHYWVFGGPWTYESGARGEPAPEDKAYLEPTFRTAGAMLVGRTMYDAAGGWGDDPGFGVTAFVLTHRPVETQHKGNTTFEFVTQGLDVALQKARKAAGGKDVLVMGGGDLIRQSLDAGVLDELTLSIAPILLGSGKRLFDGVRRLDLTFDRVEIVASPFVTHLRYQVRR